jgi:hypothetical protein
MNPSLLQRQAALAGVALLAALGAVAAGPDEPATPSGGAETEVVPADEWRIAAVGVARGRAVGCDEPVEDSTEGVVHPVLPCGAQLELQGGGETIRTQVVGRGPVGLRHEFDLTPALAARLGLDRTGSVRWRFAA